MTDINVDAFLAWFNFKYEGEMTSDNQVGFSIDVDGTKVVVFVTVWETMWSVACPILRLDKNSKKSLFELMDKHTNTSAMGLTVFDDLLCIVNCSTDSNAADADVWVNEFAAHAADLIKGA